MPVSDPRHPDVWGIVQHGVVYTGGKGKIAEHGGADPDDRDVPILVFAPRAVSPGVFDQQLETTSIAPTIIRLLGLNPYALQAVRIQGTPVLPGVHLGDPLAARRAGSPTLRRTRATARPAKADCVTGVKGRRGRPG